MTISSIKHQKYRLNLNNILNINKIILSLTTCIFCTSVASAGTMGSSVTSLFHGLYIGGSGGGSFSTATDDVSSSTIIDFPEAQGTKVYTNSPSNSVTSLKNNSGIGALFIGYGLDYKRLYLGAEAFVNYSNYQMNSSGSSGTTQFFSNANQFYVVANDWQTNTKVSPFQFGLDLRPGFLMKPEMLLYGRVGFAGAKLTSFAKLAGSVIYSSTILNGTQITDNFPFELSQSTTNHKIAMRLGAGMEYSFNQRWSARADYIYTDYGSINLNGTKNINVITSDWVGNGTLSSASNVSMKRVSTNFITIGITHYFS